MSNYRRFTSATGLYYFHARLADPRSDLLVKHIQHLRACVRLTRQSLPFDLVEAVVLPDQVHMIWRLYGDDQDYSNRWRKIKSAFSRHLPAPPDLSDVQKTRGEKGIWQRRFWEHCIRDQADLLAHRDYIWRSPVAAGLVARPTDWEHSSIHRAMARGTSDSHWEKTRYGAVARTG
jgi:putative transposase